MHLICVVILACFFPIVDSYASGAFDCPPPWIDFGKSCYNFVPYARTIQNAISTCAIDSATLVKVQSQEEHDFVQSWLIENVKESLEWFTDGIKEERTSSTSGSIIKYIWESDGSDVSGQHFWYSNDLRARPGNRIAYYTDGSSWGWAIMDTSKSAKRPFICFIDKAFIYKITSIDREFDFGVNEIDPNMLERGPVFNIEPEDQKYDIKSPFKKVQMVCEAKALPRAAYKWMVLRGLKEAVVDTSKDTSITITNGILTITEPEDEHHNGMYHCIATNEFGSIRSRSAQLSFGYLNDFPKSRREPVTVSGFEGTGIECIPPKTNYDTLVYSWYKNDPTNWIRSNVKWYVFISNDGKLYFQYASNEDIGDYICFVTTPTSSKEGKSSMPIPLHVTSGTGSEQEPIVVNSFPKSFPPSPLVGQDVRTECVAFSTSIRQLDYRWERIDGNPMPKSAIFSDYNRVMTIPNVQLSHAGTYRCHVARKLGIGTFRDTVLAIEAAPYFMIPLGNKHMDLGSTLEWYCTSAGTEPLTYEWYSNGTLLNLAEKPASVRDRHKIENNKLTISNLQLRDQGMYQCSVSNTHGKEFNSAQLRVLSFAPSFQKFPLHTNTYGLIDGNITLICNPESAPPSKKEWFKDGSVLNSGSRVQILPNGNLLIIKAEQSDKGNYTCKASNKHGEATSSGYVDVLPSIEISQPPKDTVVLVNQTAFFHCEAAHNPLIDVAYDWYHNNYKIMFIKVRNLGNKVHVFTEPHYERGKGIYRGSLYINRAQFFHAGDYHCVIKSTTQSITDKGLLVVEGPPGEPAGVLGSGSEATNITLTWWPGPRNGQDITSFIVEAMNPAEGFWRRVKIETGQQYAKDELVSSVVTGLNPYTEYHFRVFGVNLYGVGVTSKVSPLYKTASAPPIIYPLNLRGGGGKVGTLNITWDPVPLSQWNAERLEVGYIVFWKRYDMNEDQWAKATINDPLQIRHTVLVGPINFYIQYNLRISFYNPMGKGPMSPRVNCMSAEDIPVGVPITVRAVYHNSTAIRVEWQPVPNTREVMRGVLLGYRINYWIDKEEDELMALFRMIYNQTDNGLIIALRENTDYMINLQAVNTAGNGPKSEDYRTKTLRAAPMEAPQQVSVSIVDDSSVELHWRGVYTTIEEEPLEGYIVRYWRRGENIYVATNEDAGKEVRYTIKGLEEYVQYQCRVYGYSRGGDGLQSSPTLEFIIGDEKQIIRDSPDKRYIITRSGYSWFVASSTLTTKPLLSHTFITVVSMYLFLKIFDSLY